MEDRLIPLEAESQENPQVTPSDTGHMQKGKWKRNIESPTTTKKWTPISTKRPIKSQTSASIHGQPTLITCTGKITVINPVKTSKVKLPKPSEHNFEQS
ncbi:hypothetical protein O181_016662 [Austropuccinia psidii MF-1]|uniref:Uncharacterized protein n=1 Tax=Austropuccinia psidii MF-1 TaxID=1389203 RepID=A0A9Q3C4G4_9BASI|nr:hypothetical protein [Austropuccinia psidii MF-1]